MKLRDIEFGPVWDASGVRGFFGEGYWYHGLFRRFGLDFTGSTFVAKTTTLMPRTGNMKLKRNGFTPRHFFPNCVIVKSVKGVVLNAVGLSGPGAEFLLAKGYWQERQKPFMISFMAVEKTAEKRRWELEQFLVLLKSKLPDFHAPIAIQLNDSCPNVDHRYSDFELEVCQAIGLVNKHLPNVPVIPKCNLLVPIPVLLRIGEHLGCDAICLSNAIPWGELPEDIDWKELFGSLESPLEQRGYSPGGLSGWPLLKLLCDYLDLLRRRNFSKPICAGGGILKPEDLAKIKLAGGDKVQAVSIGSVAMLRPWRVQPIIKEAHKLFGKLSSKQLPP